jgi:thiamine transporter
VSEKTTNIVKWISVGGVIALPLVIFAISCVSKKRFSAKRIAFASVCVATSFTLAIIKFKPVQYGGSVTLASFVPIMLYAYIFGVGEGLMVGLIHGLLNFIESPYNLTPATFVFDYLLAFASVGVMGFFGKISRKKNACLPVVLGAICVFAVRFISHLLSGMIFFTNDAVWVSLPSWAMSNAFMYSLIYQCVYIPLDAAIAIVAIIALCKSGVWDKIAKMMKK